MAIQTFAAIYIGSYEVSLKIFEFSAKKKTHVVDHIRSRLGLGEDVFNSGSIGYERVDELCDVLKQFLEIIASYRVDNYEAYASTVLMDASNELFILNRIYLHTGIRVKVISNSEHRFISYQSVAGRPQFEKLIEGSTAVVDVGGIGVQVTLFSNRQIVTTQHLDLGMIKLRLLQTRGQTLKHCESQISEYIDKKLKAFRALYLGEGVDYLVIMNDYCMELVKKAEKNHKEENLISSERFVKFINRLLGKNVEEICKALNLSNGSDPLIIPSMLLVRELVCVLGTKEIWVPELNINDGIAYDYAQRNKLIKTNHDFEADILSESLSISRHYHSYSPHIEALSVLSGQVFDSMKKVHGLGKRERLLLKVASILHDCGKYVTLSNDSSIAYHIIMASEIIGLSHREREIIALTVLYNGRPLDEYEGLSDLVSIDDYMIVAKLSAILRVANALDQSHKQKFRDIKVTAKGRELVFTVESMEDISLEQALFESKTSFFENIFSMKPVLKEKRVYHVK